MNIPSKTATSKTPGAVIYIRVSTEEQAKHGTSPETQREASARLAEREGLPVIEVCADEGVSGKRYASRPGIQRALHLLETGQASVLIATKIDRIGRSASIILDIARRVRQAGASLLTSDHRIDDTSMGQFTLTMFAAMAELEHGSIAERLIDGHHRRAEAGVQTARVHSPFGYHVVGSADVIRGDFPAEMLGKYVIIEAEAKAVREVFSRYAAGGSSLCDLCRWLNREGVPTPGKAREWQISTLRYLLANPVYKGLAAYGRFDHGTDENRLTQTDPQTGRLLRTLKFRHAADPDTWISWEVPALVSEEVWEAVKVRLSENQRLMSGNPRQVRMLSGRVVCPCCGAGMQCNSPGRRFRADGTPRVDPPRYVCTRNRQSISRTEQRQCQPDTYRVPDVEDAVILALMQACHNPESIQEALAVHRRLQESPTPAIDPRKEIAAIDKALQALAARNGATVKAQIAGIMAGADADTYNDLLRDIAAERKDLEDRRGVLSRTLRDKPSEEKPAERRSSPDVTALLDKVRRVLEDPGTTGKVKRDIVGTVVEKVICRKGENKKAGAEIIFQPGILSEDGPFGGSTLQLNKQTSSPTRPCGVFTTVARCPD